MIESYLLVNNEDTCRYSHKAAQSTLHACFGTGGLPIFFKIHIFKKFFQDHCQRVKHYGSRSVPAADLGPNCLQTLTADNMLPSLYSEGK